MIEYPRELNENERSLAAELGAYGHWLLKWGKELDKEDGLVQEIMKWYEMYHRRSDKMAAVVLCDKIDVFCRERNRETPQTLYAEIQSRSRRRTVDSPGG